MASINYNLDGNACNILMPDDRQVGGLATPIDGLVGHWVFNDIDASGNIIDETGLTGPMTIFGNPVRVVDNGLAGLDFNNGQTGDFATLHNAYYSKHITDEYTFLIIASHRTTGSVLLSQYYSGSNDNWVNGSGRIFYRPAGDGVSYLFSAIIPYGDLNQMVVHANQTTGDYDLQVGNNTASGNGAFVTDTGDFLLIGGDSDAPGDPANGDWFDGIVHGIALYNRELTTDEKTAFTSSIHSLDKPASYRVNI